MQTFLPSQSFSASAAALDRQRLGKQRVEVLQLLDALDGVKKGWSSHPAAKMWRGYEGALGVYGMVVCTEWRARGYKDTCFGKIRERVLDKPVVMPPWLGDPEFHASHRGNLVRKLPEHYGPLFPDADPDVEYVWPE